MEKKALIAALVTMIVGGGLLHLYMRRFEAEAAGGEKIAVLMLTKDAAAGTTLDHEILGVRDLPEAYFESRHVRALDIDRVLGQKLAQSTKASESLLWTDLASMSAQTATLASLVQEGMRAVTLRADQGSFGSLLRPGDRVDVLLVTRPEALGSAQSGAQALLENVLVLAVGNQLTRGSDAEPGRGDAATVTVSVTGEQGRTLAQAETQGSLRLLLRNPDDITISSANGAALAPR